MSRASASATVFHAVADPTRRGILRRLGEGEFTAGQLGEPFSISQSALSQHLAVLRRARLVQHRNEGRKRWYRLRAEPLRDVYDWVAEFERFWAVKLDKLGAYLDTRKANT